TAAGERVGGLLGHSNSGDISGSYATGNVSGTYYVGGLIGNMENDRTIRLGSYATGTVSGVGYVGGLVGRSGGGWLYLSDSYYSGDSVTGTGANVGGLVGGAENFLRIKNAYVDNSNSNSTVTGTNHVGGMVGYVRLDTYIEKDSSSGYTPISPYSTASVRATTLANPTDTYVGGLIGYSGSTATVTDAYVSGATISGVGSYAGGLVGYAGALNIARSYATGTSVTGTGFVAGLAGNLYSGSIQNSYFSGSVTATSEYGGLTGYLRPGAWLSNSFYNIDSSLINGGKLVTAGGLYDGQYTAWAASDVSTLASRTLNIASYFPAGPTNGYYQIATVADTLGQQSDFSNMLAFVQSTGRGLANSFKFKLANSIDMSTASTPYMPYFSAAEFKGSGFEVHNFSLNSPTSNIGFLGFVNRSTVADLNVNSVVYAGQTNTDYGVHGRDYVGVAIGSIYQGVVSGSTATLAGSVNGRDYTGGFAGYVQGDIANTHAVLATSSSASVTGLSSTGGLVGNLASATASALSSNVAVSGTGNYVGGLIGIASGGNYDNLLATGQVTQTAGEQAGGLIGSFSASSLTNASASGAVSGASHYVGGLIGIASGTSLSLSHASGSVSGGGQRIGGLVGQSSIAIADSYATGAVSGSYYVGGLVGASYRNISNSYAAGVVAGTEFYVGGLVGYQENYIVSDSHASGGTVTGKGYVGGLIGTTDSNVVIEGSYSSQAVSGSEDFVGGLVGKLGGSILDSGSANSYATGSVTGRFDVGGLVGRADSTASITNAYSTGAVSADANFGGLLGYLTPGAQVTNSHYDIDAVSITGLTPASPGTRTAIAGLVTIGGLYGAQYAAWYHSGALDGLAPSDTATLQNYFGSADASGYYSLSSTGNLKDYLGYADQTTLKFKLGADIDMSSAAGLYIPYISGGFDPNSKIISHLALNQYTSNLGFIGHLRGGATTQAVAGLSVDIASVLGKTNVGAAVGSMYRRALTTPSTTGSVTGSDIGYAADPSDDNNGRSNVGGVVGYALGETSSSKLLTGGGVGVLASTATVSGGENAGGLVGRMATGTLSASSSSGAVSGATNTGGLVGRSTNGAITDVASTGAVTGTGERTGGVLGWMEGGSSVLDTAAHTGGLVQGTSQVGGLAGRTDGMVGSTAGAFTASLPTYTTYATSNVEGSGNYVGGLIGYAPGGAVVNASSSGTVTGYSSVANGLTSYAYAGYYTGGLIGESNVAVSYSRYTGLLVKGSHRTGGLIGSSNSTIANSYASAGASASSVMSNSSWAGGLAGYSGNTISNAYATASVTNMADRSGGLVGYSDGSIANSWASGNVAGVDVVGGLVGDIRGTLSGSTASGNVLGTGSYIGGLAGLVYNAVSSSQASGNVEGYGERVGGLVGQLQGSLSGSSAAGNVVGHASFVGGLVGLNYDNISTSTSTGNVYGYSNQVGGLVGGNHGGSIASSSATIATVNATTGYGVSGNESVGGLVGWSQVNISSSNATASVRGTGNYTGGFVGYLNNATISASGASGSVSGLYEVGGFAGQQYNGAINSSYANVNVESTSNSTSGMAGGFVGQMVYGSITGSRAAGPVTGYGRVGGFAGYLNYSGAISQSYATGAVTQNSASVLTASESGTGGFAGYLDSNYTGSISDVYAMGSVRGTTRVGGLIGYADQGTISNAFSTGHVSSSSGASSVGGVFGAVNTGTISVGVPRVTRSDLYFDTTTSDQASDSYGGIGLHTMALQGSLPSTNFATANWGAGTGLYPYLKLFYPNTPQALSGVALLGNGTDDAVRAQVGLYSGGVLLNGGTASTGVNGYYYSLVGAGALLPDATLTIGASTKLAGTLTLDGGSAVVGMVYSDAQTLTQNNLVLESSGSMGALRQGITHLRTGAASASVMNTEVQSTLGASNWAAFSAALPTISSLELTATAASFDLDTALAYSGNTVTLTASGSVTEGALGTIAADKLDLKGSGASFVLNSASNNVATLAADTGSVTYVDADALNVGTSNSIGITTTGPVSISTRTGDLTISQNISTTDASNSAIVLNAGVNTAAGAPTGGNVIISGSPIIGTGAGGRTTLYTGSVSDSTGLTMLVGSGSGHFRYNSDEAASNYDTTNAALGAGSYAIYREQPMLSVTPGAATSVYGESLSAGSGSTISAYVNGDASTNAVTSGTAIFTTAVTGSSHAGTYDIAYTSGLANSLGYGYVDAAGSTGEYSVSVRTLTATIANTGVSKTYDGTTASALVPNYSIIGFATGDSAATLSHGGAVYDNAHVAGASKVTVSGLAISGVTGTGLTSDYVLDASAKDVTAAISAAPLSATASIGGTLTRTYDGTTAASGASVNGSVSGAVAGDALTLDTSGLSLNYNSAHVASASSIAASGTTAFTIGASTAGSVASDYSFTGPAIAAAQAGITAATLTATIANTGVSKTYDGTTASALVPSYSITGFATGDSAATLSHSGAVYDNAHVAGASKVTVSGLAISGVTGTGLTSDYVLDASAKDVTAAISAAPLSATASIGGTLTRTYDGTTASGASVNGSVSGAVAGDALTLDTSGLSLNYNSAHVASASSVGASGNVAFTIDASTAGSVASDYSFTGPAIAAAQAGITAATLTATLSNTGVSKT
ncbi:MAG: hypothetical protein JWP59_4762, partial [Massilia sp.]|nr:hypothetical protein [Massilia sp.]